MVTDFVIDRLGLVSSRFRRNSEKAVVLGFWFNRFLLDDQVLRNFSSQKKRRLVLRLLAVFSRNRIWLFPSTLVGNDEFLFFFFLSPFCRLFSFHLSRLRGLLHLHRCLVEFEHGSFVRWSVLNLSFPSSLLNFSFFAASVTTC